MKIPQTVTAFLLLLAALWLASYCGERRGEQRAEAKARDRGDDSLAVQLRSQRDSAILASNAARDSTGREIRRLKAKIAPRGPVLPNVSNTPDSGNTVRDSLITVLTEARRADSLEILFWRAQSDSALALTDRLRASRDQWRKRSERRFACVGGPAVAVGLNGRGAVGVGVTCGWRL